MKLIRTRAFTIVELLVIVSVIAVLATILLPVFVRAKSAAIGASCLSRFRHVSVATHLYLNDYDDVFMPVNYQPGAEPDPSTDRTWVQMLLPYTGNFRTFRCPADIDSADGDTSVFDQDLVQGDLFARYYTDSMHVNLGYNFQYLAPILKTSLGWAAQPKTADQLPDPSKMLLFIDSAWEVVKGEPVNGGSWLVSPPCRYQEIDGKVIDTITATLSEGRTSQMQNDIFAPVAGWAPSNDEGSLYGGAWPWHSGRVNVASIDGNAKAETIAELGSGCEILPDWSGSIRNRREYSWSPE